MPKQRFIFIPVTILILLTACAWTDQMGLNIPKPPIVEPSLLVPIPEDITTRYTGIEQGVDADGFPRLGSLDAKIVVDVYSSFGCSHCKTFNDTTLPAIMDFIRNGQVQYIFKPITFIANDENNNAGKAAIAAICAGEQGYFAEMRDILFDWQGQYPIEVESVSHAGDLIGIDPDSLAACYNSDRAAEIIANAEHEFRDQGYGGTPTVLLNGTIIDNWTDLETLIRDLIPKNSES